VKRLFSVISLACVLLPLPVLAQSAVELKVAAPELEERAEELWINSKPLKLADLKGQVVVLHFWTFG
jgi:hypothetical protein